MKLRQILPASALVLAAALPVQAARADALLLDSLSVISGQQGFTDSFNLSSPGTLTFTLSSIPWLDTVSGLSGFLSTSSGVVGSTLTGESSESVDVDAGTIYAHWFGTAQGTYNLGVLGVKVTFQPSSVTPVPLPTSLVLILSGLGLLFGWQKRKPALPALAT